MSLPACPNCQATTVERLSRDSDELLVCANCGFGSRGEWANPAAGKDSGEDPYASAVKRDQQPQAPSNPSAGSRLAGSAAGKLAVKGVSAAVGGGVGGAVVSKLASRTGGSEGGSSEGSAGKRPVARAGGVVKKVILAACVVAAGWVVIMLVMFATIGFFTAKILDVPGLRPAASALARIACLGGHGSKTACQIHDILGAFKKSGAEDALRQTWDCSNLKPGGDRSTCDSGAISQMDGVLAIPEKDRWMIEVYIRAASKYDVPWEVLAALHGANTNFGADGDCSNASGTGGGMYDFSTDTWNRYKVDAGEEYHTDDNHCWTSNPKTRTAKDSDGKTATFSTYVTYRDKIDEDPGLIADEDPRDMVDATFTEARILAAKGAKGNYEWKYNGDDAGSCAPNSRVDGSLYAPPTIVTSGAAITDGSTLGGGDASVYDDLINQKAAKYNIPPSVIKGFVEQESNFDPNAGSSSGAQGLGQFMPNTFTGISDPATGEHYLLSQIKDPERNLDAAGRYISGLLNQFHGNLTLAAAGYNAGPKAVVDAGNVVPSNSESQEYAYSVPARIIKYGGWGEQIHIDIRYVNQRFVDAQMGTGDFNGRIHRDPGLHRLAYPIGSVKAGSPPDATGFGYHGKVTAAPATSTSASSGDTSVALDTSAAVSVSTPAGPWTGTEKFTGKKGTDKVSQAIRYRSSQSHSDCYVAIVNSWYQVLVGVTSGSTDGTAGVGGGIDQAAGLQMGPKPGMPGYDAGARRSASNDLHYCGAPSTCHFSTAAPPRSIAQYNTLGMTRNVAPKGTGTWDCSSFAGYVLWVGGGVNIISQGGNTNGEWNTTSGNVLEFQTGSGIMPVGGWIKGDLIWFGISTHIEVIKDPTHSWAWGSEPGHINKVNGLQGSLGTITNWARPLHLKDQTAPTAADGALAPAKLAKTNTALKKIGVVQEPITLDDARKADTAAYALRHYGTNSSNLNPSMIVLHFTAGNGDPFSIFAPEKAVAAAGANPELPNVSAHFVVMKNGTIKQFVPIDQIARHTIGLNDQAIGIEMEEPKSADNILARPKQIAAVLKLVRTLQANLGIEADHVIGHGTANADPNYHDLTGLKNDHVDWNAAQIAKLRKLL